MSKMITMYSYQISYHTIVIETSEAANKLIYMASPSGDSSRTFLAFFKLITSYCNLWLIVFKPVFETKVNHLSIWREHCSPCISPNWRLSLGGELHMTYMCSKMLWPLHNRTKISLLLEELIICVPCKKGLIHDNS